MPPPTNQLRLSSDSAAWGIFAGLAIGIAVAIFSFFVFFLIISDSGHSDFYFKLFVAVPYLLPLACVLYGGWIARSSHKPRFAAGFFIAAALMVLLEGSCATYLWRS